MKAKRPFWVRVKGFVGCFKPRPVQPGGHPTIPWGKIIAKPRSDGGYSLSVYHGIQIGWVRAGEVAPGEDVQAAMRNLARPVETLAPNATMMNAIVRQSGSNEGFGMKERSDGMELTPVELVDAAYELVFTYKPESPAQETWKQKWLCNAKQHGAGLDC